MTRTVTLYSTTTCATCIVADKRLTAAGVDFTPVKLDEPQHAERLAELKKHFEVDIINVPLIQWGTRYENITGLTGLINDIKEASNG